jgi:hypothetical protein
MKRASNLTLKYCSLLEPRVLFCPRFTTECFGYSVDDLDLMPMPCRRAAVMGIHGAVMDEEKALGAES